MDTKTVFRAINRLAKSMDYEKHELRGAAAGHITLWKLCSFASLLCHVLSFAVSSWQAC